MISAALQWIHENPKAATAVWWGLVSLFVSVVPSKYHSMPWFGLLLQLFGRASVLTPPDQPGTLKIPGKRAVPSRWPGIKVIPFTVLGLIMLTGCTRQGTPTTPPPIPTWQTVLSGTISAAKGAAEALRQSLPQMGLDTEQMDHVNHQLEIVESGLDVASSSVTVYAADRSTPNQCRLHADLTAVFNALGRIDAFLRLIGIPIPDVVGVVIGALSAVVDMVAPGCPLATPPAVIQAIHNPALRYVPRRGLP